MASQCFFLDNAILDHGPQADFKQILKYRKLVLFQLIENYNMVKDVTSGSYIIPWIKTQGKCFFISVTAQLYTIYGADVFKMQFGLVEWSTI